MTFPVFWRNPQHVARRCVPLKTRAVRRDRSNPTGGLDGERPQREWQPHVEDLALSWKCKVRKVSIVLWWEISNGFWGFALPFMSPLPPSLPLSLPPSFLWFWFCAEISIHSPPLLMRAALNSSRCTSERQSHKTSFYAGPISLMGLSRCTMLDSNLRNFRQAWPRPHAAEDWLTDRQTGMLALIFLR